MESCSTSADEILFQLFEELNLKHFDGFLEMPKMRFNSRLRSSAGRFIPGSRKYFLQYPAMIEVASYLLQAPDPVKIIADVVGHEMIHYWLWVRRKPFGHNPEFWAKMRQMGVSRYNPAPRRRPYRYVYRCQGCGKEFYARRKLNALACAKCCKQYSDGRYDARFALVLDRMAGPDEAPKPTE